MAHEPVDAALALADSRRRTAPLISMVALLIPASSPSVVSRSSTSKPRRSPQRRYMRSSISAQSCDSVPPAPAWTARMALRLSYSPESCELELEARRAPSRSRPAPRSPSADGLVVRSSIASSSSSTASRTRRSRPRQVSMRLRSVESHCITPRAAFASSQKPGWADCCFEFGYAGFVGSEVKVAPGCRRCASGERWRGKGVRAWDRVYERRELSAKIPARRQIVRTAHVSQ